MLRKRLIAAIAIIVVAGTLAFIAKAMRDRAPVAKQAINLAVGAEFRLPARRDPVLVKSYDFNRPADLEGWEVHTPKGPDRMWIAEGALRIDGDGVERSRIQNICELDTAEVNVIELRVRQPVRRLWAAWRLESGEWSPGFAGHRIIAQEEWCTVSIPVGQSEFWKGDIKGLWITFWSKGQPAEIEVDWIHLLRDENPSFTVRPERLGYAIADEFQWVIPTAVPGKFQREVEVPKGARLSFSCGLSKETWQSHPAEVMLRVSATTEQGETQTLASGRLQPRALRGLWGWVKGTVDLEGLAGRRLTLTFESSSADEKSAGVVLWGNPTLEPPTARAAKKRPNIIVILIDALRPDHLGMYGYEKPTSPNLDELAKESIIFENAFAQSHSTRLSVASLFTSLFPLESKEKVTGYYDLKQNITTLAERLQAAGYSNAALSANRLVHWDYAFDQGFDTFYSFHSGFPAQSLTDKTVEWLKGNSQRPFFIYLHYMDAHALYQPPRAFSSRFLPADYHPTDPAVLKSDLRVMRDKMAKGHTFSAGDRDYLMGLYDGAIASVDWNIGRLVKWLHKTGEYDNTVIVVLSDHGEEFWDHEDLEHGRTLYDEIIRVPLIVKLPAKAARKGERISAAVQLIDVYPTLLELAGLPSTAGIRGKSLLKTGSGGSSGEYAEAPNMRALRKEGWKLIDKLGSAADELYHLQEDPRETKNLILDHPKTAAKMRSEMDRLAQEREPAPSAGQEREELDPKTLERLRSLGYIK